MIQVFDTPEGCDLVIKNGKGKIEVTGWDKPQTQITAVKHSDDIEIEISQDGRKVIAKTKNEGGLMNWLGRLEKRKAVDYTVYLPHSSNVKINCVTGPVQVAELEGTVRVESVDGSVEMDNVRGEVKLRQLRPSRSTAR